MSGEPTILSFTVTLYACLLKHIYSTAFHLHHTFLVYVLNGYIKRILVWFYVAFLLICLDQASLWCGQMQKGCSLLLKSHLEFFSLWYPDLVKY